MAAFAKLIRDVYRECPKTLKYGVTINNDHLKYPIEVSFRDKWQNSPGALLNEFLKVMQSQEESSVFGAPVKVVITALEGVRGGHPGSILLRQMPNQKNLIKVVVLEICRGVEILECP